MKRVKVVIVVTETALGQVHEVAAACRALGFTHDMTLTAVGVITGSADADDLPALKAVQGVAAVEIERVQWGSPVGNPHTSD